MPGKSKWAALLIASAVASAQKPASVAGTVTNSLTGGPVLRAHVTMRAGHRRFGALTNGEGKFSIGGIAPGSYMVEAARVGFASLAISLRPMQVSLSPGEEKGSLDLKLTPVGAISGRVLDVDGEPVQLANVSAQGPGGEETGTTDNKGQYRIGGLAPGKYRVRSGLEPRDFPPETRSDGSKEVHYAPTFYAGVQTSKGATRVAVEPGTEVSGIDIPLVSTPVVKVSGKVLDVPAGTKDVFIAVRQDNEQDRTQGLPLHPVRPDRPFVIWRLDPGKYSMWAFVDGGDLQSAPVELEVGTGDIDHLELRMVPRFDISGQVRYEDEKARQGLTTAAIPPGAAADEAAQMTDREVTLVPVGPGNSAEAEIGDDDSFKFEKVQPGRYRVQIAMANDAYVKSLRVGSAEVDGDILDLRNGSGGATLNLLVSTATAEIDGTVSDSKGPVAGATVMLLADGIEVTKIGVTDSNGRYLVPGMPPGKYKLLAADETTEGLLINNAAMEDYDDAMELVELHAGDKVTKDLKQTVTAK